MTMNNKRVLFIEPCAGMVNSATWQRFTPLLGPIYLATIAEQAGYEAVVLNESILGRKVSDEELAWADQICLTCMTLTVERGKAIAQRYRDVRAKRNLSAIAHIGGTHASLLPEDVTPYFDHVAIGEGESILLDLLAGNFSEQIVRGEPVENLDGLPLLNYDLVKGWRPGHVWTYMTSRGCPYDCDFCSVNIVFGKRYRSQSPERVIKEIRRYRKGYISFMDDNFAFDRERASRVMDLIISTPEIRQPWSVQSRIDRAQDHDFVAKMRASGCKWVYAGIESVNPNALQEMHKHQTVDDIRRAVEVLHAHHIHIVGMFIFGNDSDGPDVFRSTSDFAAQMKIDVRYFWIIAPLPGTLLFQRLEKQGRLLHKKWQYYDGLHAVFQPQQMSPLELQEGMMRCYKEFYTWKTAFQHTYSTLVKTAEAGFRKLRSQPAYLPSGWNAALKFAAPKMLRTWEQQDAEYVSYLRSV